MREHSLAFSEDGRIVEVRYGIRPGGTPTPITFLLEIAGEQLSVQHARNYFPGQDHLYFLHPDQPGQAHCLSSSGYFSVFVPHDAVEACGGPEVFTRLFAEARIAGKEEAFLTAFQGKAPEPKGRRRRKERPSNRKPPKGSSSPFRSRLHAPGASYGPGGAFGRPARRQDHGTTQEIGPAASVLTRFPAMAQARTSAS